MDPVTSFSFPEEPQHTLSWLIYLDLHLAPFFMLTYILIRGKVKRSRPSLCETWDKLLWGRDPARSWCHHHISVKLSWSKPMKPWTVTKKALN